MDAPKYVLETNEAVLIPQKLSKAEETISKVVGVILGAILGASLLFRENLLREFHWTTLCLLVCLVVAILLSREKKEMVASPVELRFYDEYMVLYRPKRYYTKKVTRREVNTMKYSDITKCLYKKDVHRIHFYSTVDAKWYNFDYDGTVGDVPDYDRVVEDTLLYIDTACADAESIIKEIEAHSPIKVEIEG